MNSTVPLSDHLRSTYTVTVDAVHAYSRSAQILLDEFGIPHAPFHQPAAL